MNLRRFSALQIALGLSLLVHAVVLSIRFVDPEPLRRAFEDTPLEVILVNARSNDAPTQAKAIAQANLAGGGQASSGRAESPLPRTEMSAEGNAQQELQRRLRALRQKQVVLLAQLHRQFEELPAPDPRKPSDSAQNKEREERRRLAMQQMAELERRINETNESPRKRYISPATREAAYAIYYDQLRRRIEERGTAQFPQSGGVKLYGDLTMLIAVAASGAVLRTEVIEGSGNAMLDRQALAIARSSGPFDPFTPAMRRQADEIMVISRFRFRRDETLQTEISAR